jgi:hypothetical protein
VAEFKYTTVFGKLEGVLEKIRTTGVPPKANGDWLKALGYTSSNDKSIPPILKALGFLDGSNAPTQRWRDFRGADHRRVLGVGVREAYGELFELYPDGCARSDAELEAFFRTRTDGGDQVVKKLVGTFKALCANADVGGEVSLGGVSQKSTANAVGPQSPERASGSAPSPSLHIDIQVHISPDSSSEQIDQIFKSMAKHLYKSDS